MLEFNQWFFVLIANFIVLFLILRKILFIPIAQIFKERETNINNLLNETKNMTAKKDEAIATLNAELQSARNTAKETFASLKEIGVAKQKEILSKAEAEALEMIEKAKKELQVETEKARIALKSDIERFSEEIVNKMVKV